MDGGKAPPIPYVYVNSSGWVKNYRPVQAVLACSLEMFAFPFDKQNCSLSFRSWLHSGRPPPTHTHTQQPNTLNLDMRGGKKTLIHTGRLNT